MSTEDRRGHDDTADAAIAPRSRASILVSRGIRGCIAIVALYAVFRTPAPEEPSAVGVVATPDAHVATPDPTVAANSSPIEQAEGKPSQTNLPFPEVERISLNEAKAQFDAGSALFIDVRAVDEFKEGHIPGALSIPIEQVAVRYDELVGRGTIITYCT